MPSLDNGFNYAVEDFFVSTEERHAHHVEIACKCKKQGLGPLIVALSPSPRIRVATKMKWSKERSAIKQLNLQAQVGPEGLLLAHG